MPMSALPLASRMADRLDVQKEAWGSVTPFHFHSLASQLCWQPKTGTPQTQPHPDRATPRQSHSRATPSSAWGPGMAFLCELCAF